VLGWIWMVVEGGFFWVFVFLCGSFAKKKKTSQNCGWLLQGGHFEKFFFT
jgi:hypothetical protein